MTVIVYTIEQFNAISDAIAQGTKKVKYADKEVEYMNLEDMLRIQAIMRDQLFPSKHNNSRIYPSFFKGTKPSRR